MTNGSQAASSIMLLIVLFALATLNVLAALPPSLRYPIPVVLNKISLISTTCDSKNFNVSLEFQHPFKGLLFAKDFSQECKSFGNMKNSLDIQLPTSGCGVRLSSRENSSGSVEMFYSVTLVTQHDRHLRQISDTEKTVECVVGDGAFLVRSKAMRDAVEKEILGYNKGSNRAGRMKDEGWSKDFDDQEQRDETDRQLDNTLSASRAWMEIYPENSTSRLGYLQVGEQALLAIKCTLPVGIGWKIVDCTAHDGLGDSSQKLLDETGCPVDELLMPMPEAGPARDIDLMRHQEAVAKFAAFKFPDRDRLHLSCGLQLCRGQCLQTDCSSESPNDNRLARALKGQRGEILDRLEIFNSVEVQAPGIELDDIRDQERKKSLGPALLPFGNLPGDRTFCVSPDKMALAFCILGVIFLFAVVVAACALLRARRSGDGLAPYYTRSVFSSTSGGNSPCGSKLLLRESPCTSQSTSRLPHYGRMF